MLMKENIGSVKENIAVGAVSQLLYISQGDLKSYNYWVMSYLSLALNIL